MGARRNITKGIKGKKVAEQHTESEEENDKYFEDVDGPMTVLLHPDISKETEALIRKHGGNPTRKAPSKGVDC